MSTMVKGTINNDHVFKSLTPKVGTKDDHKDADLDGDDDDDDDNDEDDDDIYTT